jgi:hypothetical protein
MSAHRRRLGDEMSVEHLLHLLREAGLSLDPVVAEHRDRVFRLHGVPALSRQLRERFRRSRHIEIQDRRAS